MTQIQTILAYIGPLLLIALKVGVVIGGTGSLLEAVGKWRGWPKLVALGQKLEAIGTDIPKLVGKIEKLLPPGNGSAVGPDDELPTRPLSQRPPGGIDAEMRRWGEPFTALALALCLAACAPGAINWPRVAQCSAGLEPSLLKLVGDVLAGNGDVTAELEAIAREKGPDVVLCAVKQIVGDLGSAPVTARASRQVARGRSFLAKVRAQ